jgi:hypothetical protein
MGYINIKATTQQQPGESGQGGGELMDGALCWWPAVCCCSTVGQQTSLTL